MPGWTSASTSDARAMRFQPTPRQIIALKGFVFVACLVPVARLVTLFLRDALGANPIEAITRSTGWWTLAFLAITPYIILWIFDVRGFQFGGTTVLIAVGVAMELMRQIDSQLMQRNYEGFLK